MLDNETRTQSIDSKFDIEKTDSKIVVMSDLELKENEDELSNKKNVPNFPLFVYSEDFFFTSIKYEPVLFNKWYRKNGWKRPMHVLLPFTIFGYCIGCASYFAYLNRIISNPISYWIMNGIMMALSISQGILMFMTISIDVTDTQVIAASQERNVEYVKRTGIPVIDPVSHYCNICQVRVGDKTKHCKTCNK